MCNVRSFTNIKDCSIHASILILLDRKPFQTGFAAYFFLMFDPIPMSGQCTNAVPENPDRLLAGFVSILSSDSPSFDQESRSLPNRSDPGPIPRLLGMQLGHD
jgi:hypothetical protein